MVNFFLPALLLKRRMNSLRTQYQRLHKEAASVSGGYKLSARCSEILRLVPFLRHYIKTQPTVSTYSSKNKDLDLSSIHSSTPTEKSRKRKVMVRILYYTLICKISHLIKFEKKLKYYKNIFSKYDTGIIQY